MKQTVIINISWFSDVRYQFPPTTPVLPRNALRWLLISTIFYLALAAKRLISEPIESVPMADKHARYISEIATIPAKSMVTNELGDNGAHRCVDYCFCKRTAIISAAKVRYCKRKIAPMFCSFAARMAANRSCFSASSCLTPNKGICSI